MTTHRLVVPLNPYHSPTGATSANNFTPLTPFGTAPHARTATIVKHITIPTTTALTPTPYASPNLSVWSPSLTNVLPLGWHAIAWQQHCTCGIIPTIGGMMVRTLLTMTTIGKPNYSHN